MERLHIDSDEQRPGAVGTAVPLAPRSSTLMHAVNGNLRVLSGTFLPSDPIAFFCECRDPTCYAAVWMSAAAFDAEVTGSTTWLLSEGHEPSALWHAPTPFPARASVRVRPAAPPADTRSRRSIARRWESSLRDRLTAGGELAVGPAGAAARE
jgi:hypothetical protein